MKSKRNFSKIILTASMEPLAQFFRTFFTMEDVLRSVLGERGYLLNRYLQAQFENCERFTHAAAEEGMMAADDLYRLYTQIITGQAQPRNHPFYEQAMRCIKDQAIDEHAAAKGEIYPHALASEYLQYVTDRFVENVEDRFENATIYIGARDLRRRLCAACGESATIECMDEAFRHQYLRIISLSAFLYALTNELLCQPSEMDEEFCTRIYQRFCTEKSESLSHSCLN